MQGDPARRRHNILALVIIIAGVSLFHLRGLWPGQTFLPVDLANNNLPWRSGPPQPLQNWLVSDPLYQYYPFLVSAVNAIRHGSWPLWNPNILLGHPSLADPVFQSFYPVFVGLGLAFGAARGLAIGLWLHAILAAALTYGFLREIRCRQPAAILGGLTYALSGYMVTWFETPFWICTLSWLPGVLWAYEAAVRRRSVMHTALGGLAMGVAVLGGQFTFVVVFSLFLAIYSVGRTAESALRGDKGCAWPLAVLALILISGALLGAIQILPFAEFLGLSQRARPRGLLDPLPPQQLITLLVPDFYGNPSSATRYRGALNFSEGTIYAGLPALLLACLCPFGRRRRLGWLVPLTVTAIVFFVLGGPGVQRLGSVPILEYASLHRAAFLLPLVVAVLSAVTISDSAMPTSTALVVGAVLALAVGLAIYSNWGQAQEHWPKLQEPLVWAALFLLATIDLIALRARFPSARRWVDWGMVGLVFADLLVAGSRFNPVGPVAELMPLTPAVDYLRARTGLHRVVAYQLDDVLFGPNVLSTYGLGEAGGYSSVVSGRLRQLVRAGDPTVGIWWMDANQNMVVFGHPSLRLLDLLQVGHVVSPVPLVDPGVRAEILADDCEDDGPEVAAGDPLTGSFTVRDAAINRLDLRFRVCRPGEVSGAVTIRLWEGADRARMVLHAHRDAAELVGRRNLTLYFAPEKEAPGKTYTWEVSAAGPTSRTGLALCTAAGGQPAVSVYGGDWAQAYEGEVYIFERLSPVARAYVVYSAERIQGDSEAVSRLLDRSFDLRNVAIVADPLDLPAESDTPATRAEILSYESTRVVVRASALRRGLLVLGDQYHPGWRASVDSQPATILRTNHVLRGVVLPPGEHEVVFEFAPKSLRFGGCLSLVGVLVLITLVVMERHSRLAGWLCRIGVRPPVDL